MCCIALNVPILSHELYPINIPWNRGSYPHRLQHAFTAVEVGKPTPQSSRVSNGGPKQGWQKKKRGWFTGDNWSWTHDKLGEDSATSVQSMDYFEGKSTGKLFGGVLGQMFLRKAFRGNQMRPWLFYGKTLTHSIILNILGQCFLCLVIWNHPKNMKTKLSVGFLKKYAPPYPTAILLHSFFGADWFPFCVVFQKLCQCSFWRPQEGSHSSNGARFGIAICQLFRGAKERGGTGGEGAAIFQYQKLVFQMKTCSTWLLEVLWRIGKPWSPWGPLSSQILLMKRINEI